MKSPLLFLICCLFKFCPAQNDVLDSLKLALKKAEHDTTRCTILGQLAEVAPDNEWPVYNDQLKALAEKNAALNGSDKKNYLKHLAVAYNNLGILANTQGDIPKALESFRKSLELYKANGDKRGEAQALNNIGTVYDNRGNPSAALEYYQRSLDLQKAINDKQGIALSLNNIGFIYTNLGNIQKALDFYHTSLRMQEEIGAQSDAATSLNNIGAIYLTQGDFPKALDAFQKSLSIREAINDKSGMGYSFLNIGAIYDKQHNAVLALSYYGKSLKIREEIGDKDGVAQTLNNIGAVHEKRNEIDEALDYYSRSLKIEEEIGDKQWMSHSLGNLARVCLKKEKNTEALVYANRNLVIARELGFPDLIRDAAASLKMIYVKQGKFNEAYKMLELEVKMKDSINNQETQKAILKKQLQYDYEKKEAVAAAEYKSELSRQQSLAEEKNHRQKIISWAVSFGLVLVIVFAGFIARSLKLVREQKRLVELKNKETEAQKLTIEEKQKDILDSIRYARRIQKALMTPEAIIERNLKRLREEG